MKIFGREPVLWLQLTSAIVMLIGAFVADFTVEQQGIVNATTVAVMGVITATLVQRGVVPALMSALKAIMALALAFGLNISADRQAVFITLAAAIIGMGVRTQVTPKT